MMTDPFDQSIGTVPTIPEHLAQLAEVAMSINAGDKYMVSLNLEGHTGLAIISHWTVSNVTASGFRFVDHATHYTAYCELDDQPGIQKLIDHLRSLT